MTRLRNDGITTKIKLPFAELSGTWRPNDAERLASWEVLIELSTRVAAVDLDDDRGTIREALNSLFSLFETFRGVLRKHGPEVSHSGKDGNLSFAVISLRVLNDLLRPVLSEWHPRLLAYEGRRPDGVAAVDWEHEWEHGSVAREALAAIRPAIRQYTLVLAEAAQVPEMADAVLVKNAGIRQAANRPRRFARLREDWSGLSFRPVVHMVRWFDPVTLAATGWQLVRYRLRRQDARDGFAQTRLPTIDHSGLGTAPDLAQADEGAYWFDYVADLGDAFEPTMAVAWWAGRSTIAPLDFSAGNFDQIPGDGLPRGNLLVMGGDEVYPYPTADRYKNQTTGPYGLALDPGESSELIALPGNHDWYDSLDAFRDVFCSERRHGGWQTRQDASWFSVRLPCGWWLWGIDTGLDGDVDQTQRDYFLAAGLEMQKGDRLIVCSPVPAWRLIEKRPDDSAADELGVIERLLTDAVPADKDVEVPLHLAGDTHVYAHYVQQHQSHSTVHHVTAGGGGAFSHPTHNLAPQVPQGYDVPHPYRLEGHWPPRSVSRSQLGRSVAGLVFDRQSLTFGFPFALINLLVVLFASSRILDSYDQHNGSKTGLLSAVGDAADATVLTYAFVILIVVSLLLFTLVVPKPSVAEPSVRRVARRAGFVHGIVQCVAYVVTAGTATIVAWFTYKPGGLHIVTMTSMLGVAIVLGGLLGVYVFGQYARIVNRRWRIHDTIAFSGRHVRGFKHFVRMRIDPSTGAMRLYVIGLSTVHTGWAAALSAGDRPPAGTLTLVDVIDVAGPRPDRRGTPATNRDATT